MRGSINDRQNYRTRFLHPQEGRHAQEGNDDDGHADGENDVNDEVGVVIVEPLAYFG